MHFNFEIHLRQLTKRDYRFRVLLESTKHTGVNNLYEICLTKVYRFLKSLRAFAWLLAWGGYYQLAHSTFLFILYFQKNKIHKIHKVLATKLKRKLRVRVKHTYSDCLSTEMIFTVNNQRVFAIHMLQRQGGVTLRTTLACVCVCVCVGFVLFKCFTLLLV